MPETIRIVACTVTLRGRTRARTPRQGLAYGRRVYNEEAVAEADAMELPIVERSDDGAGDRLLSELNGYAVDLVTTKTVPVCVSDFTCRSVKRDYVCSMAMTLEVVGEEVEVLLERGPKSADALLLVDDDAVAGVCVVPVRSHVEQMRGWSAPVGSVAAGRLVRMA